MEKAHDAVEDEWECAEKATKARKQVKDGVYLPEVVHLHVRELEADQCLYSIFVESFRRCGLLHRKAMFFLAKEKAEANEAIVEVEWTPRDSVGDLGWHVWRQF